MRAELEALAYELKQWRREGVRAVPVAPDTLQRLREAVDQRVAQAPANRAEVPALREEPDPVAADTPRRAVDVPAEVASPEIAPIPNPPRVDLPDGDPATRLDWLRERVLSDLVCQEHVRPGKKVVFGIGSADARIFFCGEAPGAEEEERGEPFVGPAGQLLTKIIEAMGLRRPQVYIGNIMNWRPEMPTAFGNRPPTQQEMAYCLPFLRAQVAVVQPEVIVALGKTAVDGLLGPDKQRRMGQIRGRWMEFEGIPLIPTFHPSYLLRNNSNRTKRQVWEDMIAVMERLEMPISSRQRGYFL